MDKIVGGQSAPSMAKLSISCTECIRIIANYKIRPLWYIFAKIPSSMLGFGSGAPLLSVDAGRGDRGCFILGLVRSIRLLMRIALVKLLVLVEGFVFVALVMGVLTVAKAMRGVTRGAVLVLHHPSFLGESIRVRIAFVLSFPSTPF